MATPRRTVSTEADPPNTTRPPLGDDRPASGKTPARRGWRYGYSWILLPLILGIWYVGFGWGNSGGWIWGDRNVAVPVANDDGDLNGSGLVILEVANRQDYVGQSFQIRNVAVDHWSGERAVWIGSRHSFLPMLLILPAGSPVGPPASATPGSAGESSPADPASAPKVQMLDVKGKIVKAPPSAEAQQAWKLSDDDVNQLEEEGVYIEGSRVTPSTH